MHGTSGGPVVLSGYGGLVTLARPESVPEGASPRTYDTDFDVGNVGTRAGLTNVVTYAGNSVGPSPGGSAVNTSRNGAVWANPGNVMLNTGVYAAASLPKTVTLSISTIQIIKISPYGPQILVVTFTSAVPSYYNYQTYTFSGLITFTQLNGLTLEVLNASGNQAQFYIGGSSAYGPASDTGSAVITTSAFTDELDVTQFAFSVPSTSTPQGFKISLTCYGSPATVSVQMLKAGTAVGTAQTLNLAATPQTLTFGGANSLFGASWVYSDVNNSGFGVRITSTAPIGSPASVYVGYLTLTAYLLPQQANFNFVETFTAQDGTAVNLYLDADGNFYTSPASATPQVLTLVTTGITPNSHCIGVNGPGVFYGALTNLETGSDKPFQHTPEWTDRITQVGPGAAPTFSAATASIDSFAIANITQPAQMSDPEDPGHIRTLQWSSGAVGPLQSGYVVTVFYAEQHGGTGSLTNRDNVLTAAFNSGQAVYVYMTGLPSPFVNGTYRVSSIGLANPPGAGSNMWYFQYNVATQEKIQIGGPDTATGYYQMTVATMLTSVPVPGLEVGNNITVTGSSVSGYNTVWPISNTLNSGAMAITETQVASQVATYTFSVVSGAPPVKGQLVTVTGTTNANGTLNVTNAPIASSTAYGGIVNVSGTAVTWVSGDDFSALTNGETILINNSPFQISGTPSSHSLTLTASAGTITNAAYSSGTLVNGTFTLATSGPDYTASPESAGQATTAGTLFQFDPGAQTIGGSSNPIYGTSTGGTFVFASATAQLIGPGTRQGSVFFITRNGYYTAPAPPVTFTLPDDTTAIVASNIPVGPPNVVGRGIILTEPGQDGVPGANFFTIPTPVTYIVANVSYTASALIINDNTTTSATFAFTDSVLLNALAVDQYGYNLFNQIEIGDPGWIAAYADRNFYGKCRNKVQNFNNLSFDGGYLPSTVPVPLGWTAPDTYGSLVKSALFGGNAYYIKNTTAGTLAVAGLIQQSAFQDAYKQPITNPNTTYSVRVTACCPSGNTTGNLVVALVANGVVYGSYTLPFASMETNYAIYQGTLLTTGLVTVPPSLALQVSATGIAAGADLAIDRVEVYPTEIPVLGTAIYGSYAGLPEQVDGVTSKVDFSSENQQPANGAIVLYDTLYAMKGWYGNAPGSSLYSLQESANLEPAQWQEPEVSQRSGGAIGPLAFDSGEQWFAGASRAGLYLFTGGQPGKINQEIYQVWDAINWQYGNTIWVRVDTTHRRLMVGVPMATPNFWLPNAATNANPTSPNVILMCNYQGLDSGEMLKSEPQMHTTMFGTLNAIDMRRKWSIWQIPSPYSAICQSGVDEQVLFCNGRDNSKVYALDVTASTDDSVPIDSLYTTAGLPELSKRAQSPALGTFRVLWGYLVAALESLGNVACTLYPNRLIWPLPSGYSTTPAQNTSGYNTWQVPGGFTPGSPALNDAEAALNFAATRTFIEFRENDGYGFRLSNVALQGKKDVWNALRGRTGQ